MSVVYVLRETPNLVETLATFAPVAPPKAPPRTTPLGDPQATTDIVRRAAIQLLAESYPDTGRHYHGLALSGWLQRSGWSVEDAQEFVFDVAEQGGSTEPQKRAAVVFHTAQALAAGKPVTGGRRLAVLIGQSGSKIVAAVGKLLGLGEDADGHRYPSEFELWWGEKHPEYWESANDSPHDNPSPAAPSTSSPGGLLRPPGTPFDPAALPPPRSLSLLKIKAKLRNIPTRRHHTMAALILGNQPLAASPTPHALFHACAILGCNAPGNEPLWLAEAFLTKSLSAWHSEPTALAAALANATQHIQRVQLHTRRLAQKQYTSSLQEARGVRRGSHVELGAAMLRDLQGDSPIKLVSDLGALYRYAPTGLWMPVVKQTQEVVVHAYDGVLIANSKGAAPLNIQQRDVTGAVACAAARAHVQDFFVDAPAGLAFTNGFLEVGDAGATLLPHSPDNRATLGMSFDYDPDLEGPRFQAFLRSTFRDDDDVDDKIALLQEFTGMCLIGQATLLQVAIILKGVGENGKSVFLKVLQALFPPSARCAIPIQMFGQEYRRARLAGKRLNAVAELPEAEVIDSEDCKAVITGDEIEGRHIREKPFDFTPVAGHVFSCNRLPGTRDQTHGFWRRFMIVTFNRNFKDDPERDETLTTKIIDTELQAIVAWAVAGAVRALKVGLYTEPPSSVEAMKLWRYAADQVAQWLEERAIKGGDKRTRSAEAYADYRTWAEMSGHVNKVNVNNFAARLEALGLEKVKGENGNYWPILLRAAATVARPLTAVAR